MMSLPALETEHPQKAERLYWPQLDGLRTLAFLMVFCSHLMALPVPHINPVNDSLILFWNTVASWGWIGVELFFVLSAYLITTLLLQERKKHQTISFKHFLIRRMLRIWPLYYFFLLLDFVLLPLFCGGTLTVPFGSSDWQTFVQSYLGTSLLFVFNFSLTVSRLPFLFFQHIHWSVAMEEQFYIVWGAVLAKIQKTSTLFWLIPLGLIVTMAVRWFIWSHSSEHYAYYYNTFSHLDSILAGIAVALLLFTGKLKSQSLEKMGGWLFFLPVTFYLLLCQFIPPLHTNQLVHVVLFPFIAFFCGMFVVAILHGKLGEKLFSNPILVHTGRLTYGMYMFHLLGLMISMRVVPLLAGPIHSLAESYRAWGLYAGTGLILTWLMAFSSWHLIEKRFYNLRYRYSSISSGFSAEKSPVVAST